MTVAKRGENLPTFHSFRQFVVFRIKNCVY